MKESLWMNLTHFVVRQIQPFQTDQTCWQKWSWSLSQFMFITIITIKTFIIITFNTLLMIIMIMLTCWHKLDWEVITIFINIVKIIFLFIIIIIIIIMLTLARLGGDNNFGICLWMPELWPNASSAYDDDDGYANDDDDDDGVFNSLILIFSDFPF